MSKLAAIKKQIAALEAQAERIAKAEMSSAIAKVKGIMAEFSLTVEHLTHSGAASRVATKAAKKAKAKTTSVAKYADPKTGKTWSGFGRAPAWIADAKDRGAFLVAKGPAEAKVMPAAKKRAAKAVKAARKTAKPAAKKAVTSAKKVPKAPAVPVVAKKKPTVKKAAAKKSASKTVAAKRATPASDASPATPTAH